MDTLGVDSSQVDDKGSSNNSLESNIRYVSYQSEEQMPDIINLVQRDLSEPYSVYTYRYFIYNWGQLCFLAYDGPKCVGVIVCKLDTSPPQDGSRFKTRGYIAMLVVEKGYRKAGIGSKLVIMAIKAMIESDADEVFLETEVTNKPALKLYENLGFLRDKRLFRYYLNGLDALRLKLWIDRTKLKRPITDSNHENNSGQTSVNGKEDSLSATRPDR